MTSLARIDLRRNARHGMTAYGADEAGRRYAHLIACGFDEAEADTVFEAIDLPDSAAISLRISDLRALGFADPVKMITTLPPILGYARERVVLCGRIIASLSDRSDGMLARIISKPRHAIDRIVVAAPSDWNGVLAVLKEAPR